MLHLGERYRLVANTIEVVTPEHDLPKLPVARALWRPRAEPVDRRRGMAAQRRAAPYGLHRSARDRSCSPTSPRCCSTELITIDADTRIPQLTKELRWNMAYHHLARGV